MLTGEVYSGYDDVIPGDCKLHEGCPEFTVIFFLKKAVTFDQLL